MLRQYSRSLSQAAPAADAAVQVAQVIRANRLPALAFELGVANLIFSAWLFGAHPEHFWIVYLVEFPLLLGMLVVKWHGMRRLLYLTEFCWVVNVMGWLYLALELVPFAVGGPHPLPAAVRLGLARALFATANAPLALSVLALSNALVFHDLERWGSLTIHFGPALVTWAVTWKSAAVQASWPGAFGADASTFGQDAAVQGAACRVLRSAAERAECAAAEAALADAANAPLTLYLAWWLLYAAWLLPLGCTLPERRGYRSSFDDVRAVCARLLRPLGVARTAVRAQAALYLLLHGGAVAAALRLLPPLLYASQALHGLFLLGLLLFAVRQGGAYYQHAFGEKLVRSITKALDEARAKPPAKLA